jgi:hypothetical protein
MSRDRIAAIACYISGGTSLLGLIYFALLPKVRLLISEGKWHSHGLLSGWLPAQQCAVLRIFQAGQKN